MRVVLISRLDAAFSAFAGMVRAAGHEVTGLLTVAGGGERYGADTLGGIAGQATSGVDVVIAGTPARIGPLLAALGADVALSAAFPFRIPQDALNVPRFGIVNTHPAALPRYRGPNPIAWTIRNGDRELGYTVHRMDADFDTGAILAQGTTHIDDVERAEDIFGRMFELVGSLIPQALARAEAGDPGDPQPAEGASYAGFFEPAYAEIDWSRPADEVRRQVLAWRVAGIRPDAHGALTTINGRRVRVLHARLDDTEGGTPMQCADGPLWLVETEPA